MQPQSDGEYQKLLSDVIKKQIIILGPTITITKARNVPGLTVQDDGTVNAISGNPQEITQHLIEQFMELSGLIVKKTMEPLLASYPGLAAAAQVKSSETASGLSESKPLNSPDSVIQAATQVVAPAQPASSTPASPRGEPDTQSSAQRVVSPASNAAGAASNSAGAASNAATAVPNEAGAASNAATAVPNAASVMSNGASPESIKDSSNEQAGSGGASS